MIVGKGSPPQVRGKRRYTIRVSERCRITPAGAGKTGSVSERVKAAKDHPRRCGENTLWTAPARPISGSPPQVRGKHCWQNSKASRFGITPAGAGKTLALHHALDRTQDHPRRCGENHLPQASAGALPGSPPQVRGKPSCRVCKS